MSWFTTKKPSTQELVRAEHRPRLHVRRRYWSLLLLALAFGVIAWQHQQRDEERALYEQRLAKAAEQSRALEATLEQQRLQLREAEAAREQLVRRIEEMSAQAKQLKTELAFFRRQKDGK